MVKVKYQVEYLPLFYRDLEDKLDYIINCLGNKKAAEDLLNLVEKSVLKRRSMAEAFEPYKSIRERKYPYYRIYVKNFVIFYVVKESPFPNVKIMEVRRFLYKKQNEKSML